MVALAELSVLVLDCQATGASPEHGHLLELGWTRTRAGDGPDPDRLEIAERLVGLPRGAQLPWRVAALTGLEAGDLRSMPSAEEVWTAFLAEADLAGGEPTPTIIHCAPFETRFLVPLHERVWPSLAFPLQAICTLEIARRVLPDIPRRGLRALAGYFGHDTGELRRAGGHVRATAFVWHHLVRQLTARGVIDLAALEAFLERPAPGRPSRRAYPMPRQTRLRLPDGPGVYRLLRTGGDVLYVGKATSLRRRVNGYFQKQTALSERLLELLSQVRDVDVTQTASALEAALVEADEIKRLRPPYNVAMRPEKREGPWFATPDLLELSPGPDPRHPVGPLGSAFWIPRLWGLWDLLEGPESTARSALATALGHRVKAATDATIASGVATFRSAVPLRPRDPRHLLCVGSILWRDRMTDEPPPEAPDDRSATQWTPNTLAEALEDVVVAVAHAIRRAIWLGQLSESSVAWYEPGRWHGLTIERGQIVERFDRRPGEPLPVPPGHRRPRDARRDHFDLATFDRLRVLSTELRRLLETGGRAEVRFNDRVVLASGRLQRRLRWV